MQVEILQVNFKVVAGGPAQLYTVTAAYGPIQVEIPIPAYFVSGDMAPTVDYEAAEGMENLAEALLRHAGLLRKLASSGRQP
jgi:hypothetical protein